MWTKFIVICLFLIIFSVGNPTLYGTELQIAKREFSMDQEKVEEIYNRCGPDETCIETKCKEIYLDDAFFNIRCYGTIIDYQKENFPETYVYKGQTASGAKQNDYARGLVIQVLEPNKLGVGGREFKTVNNPKGEGVLVFDPRTRFNGAERYLIWLVVNDEAYPLNGASKNLTPNLKWPRDADSKIWKSTGLDPYSATEIIDFVYK